MSWTPISKAYVFSRLMPDSPPIGVIRLNDGQFEFGYAQSWLLRSDAYPLDPINLPLSERIFRLSRLPGALGDALPDSWGRRVIANTHSQQPANDVEWLLATHGRGVGSLAFSASRSRLLDDAAMPTMNDIDRVARALSSVEQSEALEPAVADLIEHGSSAIGGAQPKTRLWHEGREWIAKFPSRDDLYDKAAAEAAALSVAEMAGIRVPEFQCLWVGSGATRRHVLLVERFDRVGETCSAHYLSAHSLLAMERIRASSLTGRYSYAGIAETLRKCSDHPADDARELFKRMVLNVAINNTDDHMKNHGMTYEPAQGWRLAPAFDVLPDTRQGNEQAIGVGTEGRHSTLDNALSRCGEFGLSVQQAHQMIDEVLESVAGLGEQMAHFGSPEQEINWAGAKVSEKTGVEQTRFCETTLSPSP